jgi:hypothetical protein
MMWPMGFERKIAHAALCGVLLLSGTAAAAAPAPEPLIITRLPEQELLVTRSAAARQGPSIDDAVEKLSLAIGEALRAEQQATRAVCKSSEPPKPGTPQMFDWRARCSYVRR